MPRTSQDLTATGIKGRGQQTRPVDAELWPLLHQAEPTAASPKEWGLVQAPDFGKN